MFKYFTLLPVIFYMISCCTSADDTTTQSIELLNEHSKDNKWKNKQNNIKLKQDKLNALQSFLTNLKKSKAEIDIQKINLLIKDIDNASNILNTVMQNKYKTNKLHKKLDELNQKLREIEELYNALFNMPNQKDNNKFSSNNQKLLNVQSMTSLNWTKDTRNNSNVITNPLDVSNTNESELDINKKECIIVDLSNPVTQEQVEEYYSTYNINNNIPEQGTLPISKSYNEDNIESTKLRDRQ